MKFNYFAITKIGHKQEGHIEAQSRREALNRLIGYGLAVTKLDKAAPDFLAVVSFLLDLAILVMAGLMVARVGAVIIL